MFFKTSSKPPLSSEIRAIARSDADRRRLYDMRDSSTESFEVNGRTVHISTGGPDMEVVEIRSKRE